MANKATIMLTKEVNVRIGNLPTGTLVSWEGRPAIITDPWANGKLAILLDTGGFLGESTRVTRLGAGTQVILMGEE